MNDVFIPYKREDVEQERFYRVPKEFVEDDFFRTNLDNNMKMMYAALRDRYELSIQNKWLDNEGAVYCIYSRENLIHDLNISKNTVSKCIKKLTELNLMKEIRFGQGKPNHMYISKVKTSHINRSAKNGSLDSQNVRSNDTEVSETEKIKRYIIGQANDDYIFQYYSFKYKQQFKREHPTITFEQLDKTNDIVEVFRNEYDVQNGAWQEAIDEHFNGLSEGNNGSVLGFVTGDDMKGPLVRYLNIK